MNTRLGQGGRLVVPAEMRQALGIQEGDELVLVMRDDFFEVMTPARAIRRAQEAVRQHVPAGESLVDDLLRERREAARRERPTKAATR